MKDAQNNLKNIFSITSYLNPANNIRYNSGVLISNWYETRYNEQSHSRGIVPCLLETNKCIHSKSVYEQAFPPPMKSAAEFGYAFEQLKSEGFHNNYMGRTSSIRFLDSCEFERNITTTKTVFEKGLRKLREYPYTEKNKPKRSQRFLPEEDIMRSYGNATKTGLIDWKRWTENAEQRRPKPMSIYMETYNKPLVT